MIYTEGVMTEFETKILFGFLLLLKDKKINLDAKIVEKLAESYKMVHHKRRI